MNNEGSCSPRGSSSVRMFPVATMTPCSESGFAPAAAVGVAGGVLLGESVGVEAGLLVAVTRSVAEIVALGDGLTTLAGTGDGVRIAFAATMAATRASPAPASTAISRRASPRRLRSVGALRSR